MAESQIEDLGKLEEVGQDLIATYSELKSLGNLISVGRTLSVISTGVKSLGKLQYVGGDLHTENAIVAYRMTTEEIRQQVEVVGGVYLRSVFKPDVRG